MTKMTNQAEPQLTGSYAIVRDVVRQNAPSLAKRGFDFSGVSLIGSPELQQFPSFAFLNKRTGMQIDISFIAAAAGLNGGFNVMIIAAGNRKLDVEDYLKLHKLNSLAKPFTYGDPKTDLRLFADSFFKGLDGIFDKELKPILDGKLFEETPIDWMGYR